MTLLPLLTPRTRLVAFTATSNILGAFTPVKQAVELVREKTNGRAMTVVDCVASAPHGRMDMKQWGVDVVLFSYYKVRGVLPRVPFRDASNAHPSTLTVQLFAPHLSCLIVSPSSPLCTLDIPSLGHYFHPHTPSYKLAPGGAPYELQAGCAEVLPYLLTLGCCTGQADDEQAALNRAYERIRTHERKLTGRLLDYLVGDEAVSRGLRVVGPQTVEGRAPTISFVVVEPVEGKEGVWRKRMRSRDVVKAFDDTGEVSGRPRSFHERCHRRLTVEDAIPPDWHQVRTLLRHSHHATPSPRTILFCRPVIVFSASIRHP
jgi:selenocysteine lyase/cysteine desulfurase